MDARKIIQFGNSSYVISIPKPWINENKLKKGDLIFVEKNADGELVLLPREKKEERKEKKIVIDADGKDIVQINRELISAYVNNYTEIILNRKDVRTKLNELKKRIVYKIGFNIIEKNHNQIIIKDLLDPKTISIKKTVKRVDNLIRAMFVDLKNGLDGTIVTNQICKEIYDTDEEINKLYFLVLKVIKKAIKDPALLKHLNIDKEEVLDIYWLIMNFEHAGDEIKRIAKFLIGKKIKKKTKEKLVNVISDIEKIYLNTMKAYFQSDKNLAIEICMDKNKVMKNCSELSKNDNNMVIHQIIERLKTLEIAIHNISKYIAY